MTLQKFDFRFQPSIDRRQIETLATCAFVRDATTLLVQGAPGLGKTHLWHSQWHTGRARGTRRCAERLRAQPTPPTGPVACLAR